jgi:hypothetical protein
MKPDKPSKPIDRLATILLDKKTVITRANFWRIPHGTRTDEVHLKIGRYKKRKEPFTPEELESDAPKSELTLDDEEFKNLIDFLRDNYEPFRAGFKAFIPLDRPFERENAQQIKNLFSLPEKEKLLEFILNNEIIPNDLIIALQVSRRVSAIRIFDKMLNNDLKEPNWQTWFKKNDWVLGTEFVRVLDERHIDTANISDFLMEAYDGYLDVIEIKRPEGQLKFWADTLDHGNYIPSSDLIKAITQASKYLYELEREANSVKFLERVGHVKTIKPRCILIFGRSHNWNNKQREAYRILNSNYYNLTIMTYDHVLERARRIVGLKEKANKALDMTEQPLEPF